MARQPLRPCGFPMCGKLTNKGYCDDHENHRPSKKSSLYNYRWQKKRVNFLILNPFCCDPFCKHKGKKVLANVVDHKVPHKGNMVLFWDENNWQGLCDSCHSYKTRKYDMGNWGL